MSNFSAKVHKDGPDKLVVESGGEIEVKVGGAISNAGDSIAVVEPAAFVADFTAPTLVGVDGTGDNAAPLVETQAALDDIETTVNGILAALQAAGIMAES